jgi:hypothetical protein
MAVSGAIIDYTSAGGDRNITLYIQLTFSGSFPAGGDSLNLNALTNPYGLPVEGVFELPLTLGPAVYLEDIGGYYVQPKITGSTLSAFVVNVYQPGGAVHGTGAYATQVSGGNVILTMQRRRV